MNGLKPELLNEVNKMSCLNHRCGVMSLEKGHNGSNLDPNSSNSSHIRRDYSMPLGTATRPLSHHIVARSKIYFTCKKNSADFCAAKQWKSGIYFLKKKIHSKQTKP